MLGPPPTGRHHDVLTRDYAGFQELVERAVDRGERSVLFHGPPVFVALTSGTTGTGEKRIVYDRVAIKAFASYEFTLGMVIMRHTDFNPFLHDRLYWGAAAPVSRTASGVEQGYISGYMASRTAVGRSRTFSHADQPDRRHGGEGPRGGAAAPQAVALHVLVDADLPHEPARGAARPVGRRAPLAGVARLPRRVIRRYLYSLAPRADREAHRPREP